MWRVLFFTACVASFLAPFFIRLFFFAMATLDVTLALFMQYAQCVTVAQ